MNVGSIYVMYCVTNVETSIANYQQVLAKCLQTNLTKSRLVAITEPLVTKAIVPANW